MILPWVIHHKGRKVELSGIKATFSEINFTAWQLLLGYSMPKTVFFLQVVIPTYNIKDCRYDDTKITQKREKED